MTPEQWLQANGGPRRFESGAVGDTANLEIWLLARGWRLSNSSRNFTLARVGAKGRGHGTKLTREKLVAFVDDLRAKEGLEPLRRAGE